MFLSTNSLSIVYTFSWEYISISSHIVVCPFFNITSVHLPELDNTGHSLGMVFLSAEMQSVYSAALADWASKYSLEIYFDWSCIAEQIGLFRVWQLIQKNENFWFKPGLFYLKNCSCVTSFPYWWVCIHKPFLNAHFSICLISRKKLIH